MNSIFQTSWSCVQETFTSSVTDPDRGIHHLLREARNGRVPVLSPDGRRSEQPADVRSRLRLSRGATVGYSQSRDLRTTGRSPVPSRTSVNAYEAGPLSHSRPSSLLLPRDSQSEVAPLMRVGGPVPRHWVITLLRLPKSVIPTLEKLWTSMVLIVWGCKLSTNFSQ